MLSWKQAPVIAWTLEGTLMEVPNNFSRSSFLLLRRLGRQRRFLVRVRIWLPIPWYARLEVVALALPGLAQAYILTAIKMASTLVRVSRSFLFLRPMDK
jgi:hypothetical protein